MRSFEYDYLLETPISHTQGMTLRALGEYRGREALYIQQSPELLETLRKVAMVQSVESSNRIEGITVGRGRADRIVLKDSEPGTGPNRKWQDIGMSWQTSIRTIIE
ncbi:MAG: hypothetical protein U5R49_23695 [Deltaproteobacteria bacterium]|nr:hypothetical protein [Deltaproteobacteria bacterium]